MSVRKCFSSAFVWIVFFVCLASANAQTEARIQVVQTGVDPLKDDLKYLVELSPTPALKKQWAATLEPLLDSFAVGLNTKKPMRVDVVIGKDVAYEMHFPIQTLQGPNGFITNVKGLGYSVNPLGPGLYSIAQAKRGAPLKPLAFMRDLNGYASIAPTQAAVPANLPDPIKAVANLLPQNYDVVGLMKNSDAEKDMAARKANFQQLRKELEVVPFKRNEDKDEYALRKLTLQQNLNELERFVVETDELHFGWTTTIAANGGKGKGHGDFTLTALKKTDLAKSIEILADKPSYFANVQLAQNSSVSGKLNFAIDELRADHLREFYKAAKPVLESQISKRQVLEGESKKLAAKDAAGFLLEMVDHGIALRAIDMFVDLRPTHGKYTLICGIRSANGKKADDIVKRLKDVNPEREVKLDIEEIGGASLHSVSILKRRHDAFEKLFPGEKVIYVATSKDAVWGAIGVDAVKELKAAIEQAAQPAPAEADPRVAYFTAQLGPLMDLVEIIRPEREKIDEKLSKEEQNKIRQRQKELDQMHKLAIDATKNCEAVISGELKRKAEKVEGSMEVNECFLTFIGSVIADFAKDMQ